MEIAVSKNRNVLPFKVFSMQKDTLFSQNMQAVPPRWHFDFLDRLELKHWLYISDEAHKLLTYFLWIPDGIVYCQNIADDLSIPLRTIERTISRLKQFGILSSNREFRSDGYRVRSSAEYSLQQEGLHNLDTYLLGINFPDYPKKSPYSSILISQSSWKKFNYFTGPPKLAKCGKPRKHPFGDDSKIPEEFKATRLWQFIKKSNYFAGPPKHEILSSENALGISQVLAVREYNINFFSFDTPSEYLNQKNGVSGETRVFEKISRVIGDECSKSDSSQFAGMKRMKFPSPSSSDASAYENSRTSHEDGRRATEKEKTDMALGFIKNAPQNGVLGRKRCIATPVKGKKQTPNLSCEKYIDYWNELAQEIPAMPKCTKTRAGKETKLYKKALTFFSELQSGKIIRGSSNFPFSTSYMSQFLLVTDKGFTSDMMFQLINKVAHFYNSDSMYLPTSFDSLIYSKFTKKAKESGSGQSVFLELLEKTTQVSMTLEFMAEQMTASEHRQMRDYLIPFWHKTRGLDFDYDIPENEMFELISGLKFLTKLWKSEWKNRLSSSKWGKEQIPNFNEFLSVFFESLQIEWREVPIPTVFNPRKRYLGAYLNFLESKV